MAAQASACLDPVGFVPRNSVVVIIVIASGRSLLMSAW